MGRERPLGPLLMPVAVFIVAELAAEIAHDIVLIGLFADRLFNGGFNFGGGKVFEAGLELVSGGESEFGCELGGLGVVVRIQAVDGPEFDQELFLMTLCAMPPPPDKVHGDDVL